MDRTFDWSHKIFSWIYTLINAAAGLLLIAVIAVFGAHLVLQLFTRYFPK